MGETDRTRYTPLAVILLSFSMMLAGCAGTARTPQPASGAIAGHTGLGVGTGAAAGPLGASYLYDQHEKAKQPAGQPNPAPDSTQSRRPQPPWSSGP